MKNCKCHAFFAAAMLAATLSSAVEPLAIARQGFFASGGTVTAPRPGDYDVAKNWLDATRAGNTAHVDHANTLYQIPAAVSGPPVVFLHGYGQSRLGWLGTPDGRPGWSEFFLRAGHPVFLVDQPRRGEAGASARMPGAFPDAEGPDAKDYLPGDQAWYTHFRIGRVPPERYEGSQFPGGDEALDQFLRQGAPNTGDYDEALFGAVLGEVLADVRARTGRKAVYVTHSQGGRVGWATPPENVAAIVAVEPGFCPEPGDARFRALLAAKVPVTVLFGDGIDGGPADIQSTAFWRAVRDQAKAFAAAYREAGGDAEVLDLPALGIRGNSHFLFQERNSDRIAAIVLDWLRARKLAAPQSETRTSQEPPAMTEHVLDAKDATLADIGAAIARGEQDKLAAAFSAAFDAGLTLDQAKEVVGQLYAYCGFPRALNAAATLMEASSRRDTEARSEEGGASRPGEPEQEPFTLGEKALETGTANQTRLCGGPVSGPLFDFHPQLDAYLKAHLFGDIFARTTLDWRTRELVTVAALAARPETAPQCASHVRVAQLNGVTPAQTDAILALVRRPTDPAALPKDWSAFPVGEPNVAYAQYFTGRSFLHKLTLEQVPAFAVSFEPSCRNNWHIHHAETGGGQILICTAGRGYYQEWGKPAVEMKPGDTVNIPAGVKHWHGAAPDSWFQHIALEVPGTGLRAEWLEPVDDATYAAATAQQP